MRRTGVADQWRATGERAETRSRQGQRVFGNGLKFGWRHREFFFEFQHVSEGRGARESGARAWRAGNVRKSQQLATTSDRQGQMQGRGKSVDK